jgi:hypothetical protein
MRQSNYSIKIEYNLRQPVSVFNLPTFPKFEAFSEAFENPTANRILIMNNVTNIYF